MYRGRHWSRASLAWILQSILILAAFVPNSLPLGNAQPPSAVGSIAPAKYPLLFGSSGNVEIDIPKPGIAVRIEIPREFLEPGGVSVSENATSFVTSNIRNDYYYYNLVDESQHWTYDWRGTNSAGEPNPSDGPCFKPNFSYYDTNAPYCLEIWNYLNSPYFSQPVPNFDYCANNNATRWVFNCFSPPKFVLLHNLASPTLAGLYNFTLFVANRTNTLGYPDFVHAWNTTLYVPVSMAYNAGFIVGNVCDAGTVAPGESCNSNTGPIRGKGVVYAVSESTGTIVGRAYLNQSLCQASMASCGRFNLTGLAPGNYQIEGSAGVDHGVAYSLTVCCSGGPPYPATTITVPANSNPGFTTLPLQRAPVVCGTISYQNSAGNPIDSLSGNPYLIAAGFGLGRPNFKLNVTAEGTDPDGHIFRFEGVSSNTATDTFNLTTGVGVKYVDVDPYGTEFAGLPTPEDFNASEYTISVNVWVSGYVQYAGFATVSILPGNLPGTSTPSCSPAPNQPTVSITLRIGGLIRGTLVFQSGPQTPEPPRNATASLPIPSTGQQAFFGGNVVVEAYDQTGILRGVTVINGTLPNGKTGYASCNYNDTCSSVPFYVVGFSEYYNRSLSGGWREHDYGLTNGTYSLLVNVRGYELTSTNPSSVSITSGGNGAVTVYMTRGGAFEVTVASFDNRFGTRAPQACLPWRFMDSTIPVRARVYFYNSGAPVGYVEVLMEDRSSNLPGVIVVAKCTFQVVFTGQNWALRDIWFYGESPTYLTNATYTIEAFTLGYVPQFPGGISAQNSLVGFSQAYLTLFMGNEIDETVPIFSTPQSSSTTPEYDHAIGQVVLGGLMGAETANLTQGVSTLGFNVFGYGGMQLNATLMLNSTYQLQLCETNVTLSGSRNICGQGHFFYVAPDGSRNFDYGLDVGNYTAVLPEFGFTAHFMQVSTPPSISFTDLLQQNGVVFQATQMALVMQGTISAVQGWTFGVPSQVAPLSWAEVYASNSTYSRAISTADGNYDGVGALFLPGGTYNVTFSDIQYQSQTVYNYQVGWGGSYNLTPPTYLCPIGSTC